jgi:hypothetical protein
MFNFLGSLHKPPPPKRTWKFKYEQDFEDIVAKCNLELKTCRDPKRRYELKDRIAHYSYYLQSFERRAKTCTVLIGNPSFSELGHTHGQTDNEQCQRLLDGANTDA